MIYDQRTAPGATTANPIPNTMTPPTLNNPNIYGYDYWQHMHRSCYYKLPESRDPYVFDYNGAKARLSVGFYPQDPRYMRLALVGEDGHELYEITDYFRNAYGELEWQDEIIGVVPRYAAMCRDCEFEASASVFHQLLHKHLCVPVYSPQGKILVRSNSIVPTIDEEGKQEEQELPRPLEALPEYVFDDKALRFYDEPGMIAYDRAQELYEAARYYWPGGEQTWTLAVIYHYDNEKQKLLGWPKPDDYIGDISLESAGRITDCVKRSDGDADDFSHEIEYESFAFQDEIIVPGIPEPEIPKLVMGDIEKPVAESFSDSAPAPVAAPAKSVTIDGLIEVAASEDADEESNTDDAVPCAEKDNEKTDDSESADDAANENNNEDEPHRRMSVTEAFNRSFASS